MKIIVNLDPDEIRYAAQIGVDLEVEAIYSGLRAPQATRANESQKWWQSHVVGAIGEYAACKALGYEWHTKSHRFKQPDCGPYQVRTVETKVGCLKVRPRDAADAVFILAQYWRDRVCLHGWLTGTEVRTMGRPFHDAFEAEPGQLWGMEHLPEWDRIEWSDQIGVLDPDAKLRAWQESMTG